MKYGFEPKEEQKIKKIIFWLILLIVIAVIYFTGQAIEASKIYYIEKRAELVPVADTSDIPFGIMLKVRGMPWEDILWDEETKILHMTIKNNTGTITNAEELRTYHMNGAGSLDGGVPFNMGKYRGLLTIRMDYRFEDQVLTLIDTKYQKELCQIDLSEELEEEQIVSGISIGYMQDITIGETIRIYVTPGYQIEGIPEKIFYKNMPTLQAEIAWEYDDIKWATYEIGELHVAWMNEEEDAILAKIPEIDENGISYDEVEWVNVTGKRASELDLHMGNVPSGVYIYNETEELKEAELSESCEFIAVDGMNHDKLICLDKDKMIRRVKKQKDDSTIVYHLVIEDGEIVKLQEQYVPQRAKKI